MTTNQRLATERFPRSAKYNPDWLIANCSGGMNSLWMAEWLSEAIELRPGMRVLDLGCGRASSSIFLRREFGAEVWAADLWFSVAENLERIRDAGVADGVFPLHLDARALPFAPEFFDAIVSIGSYYYYGTDDTYLPYLARFVKPGGPIGIAGEGLVREFDGVVPEHLRAWWTPEMWSIHSAEWWRGHWERTGIVDVELADSLTDGWRYWAEWLRGLSFDTAQEVAAIEADAGRWIGCARAVGRRRQGVELAEPIVTVPTEYVKTPLLRADVR